MNVLTAISPGLKVLFERVGKPEIVNRPDLFRSGGAGAVIACNHVGWAESLWMVSLLKTPKAKEIVEFLRHLEF
jgi:1-acyl-sn-glycerol-3-phosphate acyltransferase